MMANRAIGAYFSRIQIEPRMSSVKAQTRTPNIRCIMKSGGGGGRYGFILFENRVGGGFVMQPDRGRYVHTENLVTGFFKPLGQMEAHAAAAMEDV